MFAGCWCEAVAVEYDLGDRGALEPPDNLVVSKVALIPKCVTQLLLQQACRIAFIVGQDSLRRQLDLSKEWLYCPATIRNSLRDN